MTKAKTNLSAPVCNATRLYFRLGERNRLTRSRSTLAMSAIHLFNPMPQARSFSLSFVGAQPRLRRRVKRNSRVERICRTNR